MKTKPCILVVDNDVDLTDNICEIMENSGYTVESAYNGNDAIALSQKNEYDIILADIELPDISGNEVVREISKTSTSTEFIYITGKATIDSAMEAVNNKQVVSYETKPIDIDRFLVLLRQIIERKQAEEALRASEERFRRYFELGLIGMAMFSPEKGWMEFNDTLCNMFGYSREDFAKTTWPELTHPEDLEPHLAQFNRVLAGEIDGYSIETRFIRRDGSILYTVLSAKIMRKADGPMDYFVVLIHDVTERKKMEEALLQSEKLKAMGMITAGIAHDFNNILAIITGVTQVLEMDNEENKELMNALHTISKASNDGAKIVRRMSMFTRQVNDTSGLVPVEIKSVLKQAIKFVKPRWMNIAKARGIDYDIDDGGITKVPRIMGIESELREVFINMMNNAFDAMKKGGCLSFRTWQKEKNLFISISDTGEGMSEEVKKRVFDPFYTTKREKGSGLGMSISHGIIESHGGRIEVNSELEKGTTFTLRFPIAVSPAQKTESSVEDQEIKAKGLNVLVVDDKEDMCSLLERFFTSDGHTVKTVEGGTMAIEVLKTETFDLVLCDLVMPDMSGHKVVAVLNRLEKRPIIGLMTGWSERMEAEDENELNVDFIIRKPFEFPVLITHINEAFGADSSC